MFRETFGDEREINAVRLSSFLGRWAPKQDFSKEPELQPLIEKSIKRQVRAQFIKHYKDKIRAWKKIQQTKAVKARIAMKKKFNEEMDAMRAEKKTIFAQHTHDLTEVMKQAETARKTLESQTQNLTDLKRKVGSRDTKEGIPDNNARAPHRRRHHRYRNETSNSHATYPGYHQTDVRDTPQFITIPASSVQHFITPNRRPFTHNRPPLKFIGSKSATEPKASTKKPAK